MAKKQPAAKPATAPETKTFTKLQRHPLSEKFSLPTSEDERLALATDMEANGQHQEIIIFEGMVLDGWERYMGCLQKGITPKFKEYSGTNPAAVAFGANAIRRKLNSVQKALFGAKYFLHCQTEGITVATQKQVAKSVCCSLQRLNEIVQLLRAVDSNEAAAKCVATLNTNPDITTAMLQNMLVDCGIIDLNARKPAPPTGGTSDGPGDEDDDSDDGDDAIDNDVDDLLGGADIDALLDGDDVTAAAPTPKGDKGNRTGVKIGPDKRARETPASSAARNFRALTEPERVDFVKFAWSMLRPAVEACVQQGRVEWALLGVHADAGKSAMADAAAALAKVMTTGAPGKPGKAPKANAEIARTTRTAKAATPAPAPVAAKGKRATAKAATPAPAAAKGKGASKGKRAATTA